MYNRYIPQPDGSFCRNRVEEPKPRQTPHHHPQESDNEANCPPPEPAPCIPPPPQPEPCRPTRNASEPDGNITGFLHNLLPKDLDSGDLIVILLLLLLAGDCEEDRSTALLTLAMYLFM